MGNKLKEIPFEKWPQLRDLYRHLIDSPSCYNTIQTFIDWYSLDPNVPLTIYTPSDEWDKDGTYIAHLPPLDYLYCNTLKDDLSDLVHGLNCFDNSNMVAGFQERLLPAVEKHFLDSGLTREQFLSVGAEWKTISREKALNFNTVLPNNTTTKDLDKSHAEQINDVWPHKSQDSLNYVKHLIKYNKSVGIFEDNNLVAWCLIEPLGSLSLLQVEESHKRRGLGKLAAKLISKYLAENNAPVAAAVVFGNVASRCMFQQLGFKANENVYWTFRV